MHNGNLLNRSMLILLICSIFFMSFTALASYPKTFTDTQGREITLDKPLERIITRSPDEARTVIALGYGDKLIAGEQATKSCLCPMTFDNTAEGCIDCFESIIDGRMPDLPEISTRYDIYFEKIAALKPDLIFCGNLKDAEAFEDKIGCPVVVLGGQGWNFGEDGYYNSIRVAGQALDAEDKADEERHEHHYDRGCYRRPDDNPRHELGVNRRAHNPKPGGSRSITTELTAEVPVFEAQHHE